MKLIMCIWVLAFLAVCAVQDLKAKEIKLRTLIFGGIISAGLVIFGLLGGAITPVSTVCGLLPGTLVLLMSYASKGKIGVGDGIILCICGALTGGLCCIACLFYGLLLTALFSMILMAFRKLKFSGSLPFVPFLFFGTIIGLVTEKAGV